MIEKVIFAWIAMACASSARAATDVDMSGLNTLASEHLIDDSRFHAIVGFDSSSFLYQSTARGTSSTTFTATVADEFDSTLFHAQGDLQFYSFVNSNPSIGVESKELYLQTQKGKLGDSQITVGRKLYEWSKLDHAWTMMSVWSPRWTWDEIHPELIGMTGVFYTYTTPHFDFIAFGSPLAVPERGTDTEEQNGNIVSANPFWKPLPGTVNVLGTNTPVSYSLLTPSLHDILFRPNFALRGKYHADSGFWVSANTGVLPINMVQLSAEPFLSTTTGNIQVNVRPEFPMRNISTAETGFEKKDWDVWASISYEQPFQFENQSTWLNPIITPSSILSVGTDIKLTHNFAFNGGALFIHEQPFTSGSNLSGIDVTLPSRFPLKQAFKVGGNWKFNELTESNLTWIQDLQYQSHFISLDAEHTFRHAKITVGGGADILLTDSDKGWVGQYYGDDRIRGWLKYAF